MGHSVSITPNSEPQGFFLSLPSTIFEAICGGEAGGGKTQALLAYPVVKGWYKHPKFIGILFRETFPELEKSLIPRAMAMYEPLGGKWNGQDKCFDFKKTIGGGRIFLSYIRNMKDARKHDTNEYNYVGWDEITHFEQRPYRYILHRVRSSTPELPAVIRAGATPGGIGNLWVYKRFVKPWRDGRRVLAERQKSGRILKRTYVPIKLSDNVDLNLADPEYEARIDLLPEAERKAKRGDWLAFIGTVFSEFRTALFAEDDDPTALHVIPPFEIPYYWPRILAIDWGFSDGATCCLWGAVSPDGRLYIYREFLVKYAYISEWAAEIKKRSYGEKIVYAVIDPSAAKRMGHPKTIMEQAQEALGFVLDRADNDRIGGKMLLHEMFRWKKTPKIKAVQPATLYDIEEEMFLLRNYGEEAVREYMERFLPERDETNLPKMQIFSTCINTIEAIQLCTYDTDGKDPEDVAEFEGDDPYDDIRYMSKAFERFIKGSVKGYEEAKRLEAIHKQLQISGDMGSFIRKMAKHEREHESGAVRRNRGFRRRVRAA